MWSFSTRRSLSGLAAYLFPEGAFGAFIGKNMGGSWQG
jgi:hypothetical protein